MRREKSLPISAVFELYVKENGLSEGLLGVDVVHTWDNVIGPVIAKYVLSRYFREGKLVCTISSASARNAISLNRVAYIKKINEELGREVVKEIILR